MNIYVTNFDPPLLQWYIPSGCLIKAELHRGCNNVMYIMYSKVWVPEEESGKKILIGKRDHRVKLCHPFFSSRKGWYRLWEVEIKLFASLISTMASLAN